MNGVDMIRKQNYQFIWYLEQDLYEQFWKSLHIIALSLTDIALNDSALYQDFKVQLKRIKDGCWKTRLMWKDNSTSLENNKLGSFGGVKNL